MGDKLLKGLTVASHHGYLEKKVDMGPSLSLSAVLQLCLRND